MGAQFDDFSRLREYISRSRSLGVERLPPEPKLSEELNVSRGRLRTLLKKVESEGLIWRHVGKGTFIGQRRSPHVVGHIAESVSVEQVFQARLSLEPQLAAQAAIHATAADLTSLEASIKAASKAASIDEWRLFDRELHQMIAKATHNPLLALLYETMTSEVGLHIDVRIRAIFDFSASTDPRRKTDEEHLILVNAIKTHDPKEAERLMRQHILSVRSRIFGKE